MEGETDSAFAALVYVRNPEKRGLWFGLQALSAGVLMLGAFARAIYLAVTIGPA